MEELTNFGSRSNIGFEKTRMLSLPLNCMVDWQRIKNAQGFFYDENPFYPRSPYGVAKIYGFDYKNYREA
jgi:GDP-D-mannose dehydratase